MALEQKILIVIDPTADDHPAVNRVINLMALNIEDYRPDILLLFAIDHSSTDTGAENDAIYRDETFILSLINKLRDVGLNVSIRISWSKDWSDSILHSAQAMGATSIMVSHPGEKTSKSLSDEFWHLIRNTSVPVGIIQSSVKPRRRHVLMAMDVQDHDLEPLNRRIFQAGQQIANAYGAELHLANAYPDSSSYPDRGRAVSLTGLPNENIHLRVGEPDEALAEITEDLQPDIVVIGATRRTGIRAALRGRKIGRILRNIKFDLLVIV